MTTRVAFAAASLTLVLALGTVPAAQVAQPPPAAPLGVLVGLHRPGDEGEPSEKGDSDPPSVGRLHTLWIAGVTPSKPAGPVALAHLLVPRKTGFWRMGLLGECAEEPETDFEDKRLGMGTTIADHPWAAPAGAVPRLPLPKLDYVPFHSALEGDWLEHHASPLRLRHRLRGRCRLVIDDRHA